jgi:hypothetical protein
LNRFWRVKIKNMPVNFVFILPRPARVDRFNACAGVSFGLDGFRASGPGAPVGAASDRKSGRYRLSSCDFNAYSE